MESAGNSSGSMQSSSSGDGGGGGDDKEYESGMGCGGDAAFEMNAPLYSLNNGSYTFPEVFNQYYHPNNPQQQQQQQLSNCYFDDPAPAAGVSVSQPSQYSHPNSSLLDPPNLMVGNYSAGFEVNNGNPMMSSTAAADGVQVGASSPCLDPQIKNQSSKTGLRLTMTRTSSGGGGRKPKKRARVSQRAATTVLSTDTTNFRQMVQEFTGIPTAFSDVFGGRGFTTTMSSTMNTTNNPHPPYLILRPFPRKPAPLPFLNMPFSQPQTTAAPTTTTTSTAASALVVDAITTAATCSSSSSSNTATTSSSNLQQQQQQQLPQNDELILSSTSHSQPLMPDNATLLPFQSCSQLDLQPASSSPAINSNLLLLQQPDSSGMGSGPNELGLGRHSTAITTPLGSAQTTRGEGDTTTNTLTWATYTDAHNHHSTPSQQTTASINPHHHHDHDGGGVYCPSTTTLTTHSQVPPPLIINESSPDSSDPRRWRPCI